MKYSPLLFVIIVFQSCGSFTRSTFYKRETAFENNQKITESGYVYVFEYINQILAKEYCKDICAPINLDICYGCNPRKNLLYFYSSHFIPHDKCSLDYFISNDSITCIAMGIPPLQMLDSIQRWLKTDGYEGDYFEEISCLKKREFIKNGYILLAGCEIDGYVCEMNYKLFLQSDFYNKKVNNKYRKYVKKVFFGSFLYKNPSL